MYTTTCQVPKLCYGCVFRSGELEAVCASPKGSIESRFRKRESSNKFQQGTGVALDISYYCPCTKD